MSILFTSILAMIIAMQMLTSNPRDESELTAPPRAGASGGSPGLDSFYTHERQVIRRDSSGQFHLTGQVNGEDVRFLVDTGADILALSVETAEAAGIEFDAASFEPITQTASGVGLGTQIEIEHLEVGGVQFDNVRAIIVEGLGVNLLGQSVLRRLGKVEMQGDRMVIHPN
jgi:aspartyl protease family protein